MTTSHCLLSQESNRNRHHTCIFYWSFSFVVKGRGEEISISYPLSLSSSQTAAKYAFHHARLRQGDVHLCGKKVSQAWAQQCALTKQHRTAVDQVCSYSLLWHLWEWSLEDPSLSYWFVFRHKGYYTEKDNILFPIAIIDSMRSNRSHFQQGSVGKAIWHLCPETTWIHQEGRHSWDGEVYKLKPLLALFLVILRNLSCIPPSQTH